MKVSVDLLATLLLTR